MEPQRSAFRAYVDENRDRFLKELVDFCRQPGLSATGEGMQPMADLVTERLDRLGAEPRQVHAGDSYPYVLGEIGDGPRTLLIYNHYDVQPADRGDGWTHDPFDPQLRDGRLYARGVADNKANMLFRIQAVEAFRAVYGTVPLRVRFVIEGEEEIGSPNLPRFAAENVSFVRADGCIWEGGRTGQDGRPVLHLGLRGILYVELTLVAPNHAMHSSWANVVANPAMRLQERLMRAVDSLTDDDGRIAFGNLGAGRPLSVDDEALLDTIPFNVEAVAAEHNFSPRPNLDDREALRRLLFEPTCNVCGMRVGYAGPGIKTVIPNTATAKLDFRLPAGLSPDLVETHLREHLDANGFEDVQIRRLAALEPARTSPRSTIARVVRASVRDVYAVEPIIYPLMPASGPMYALCQVYGTPAVTFGAGHAGDNVHGVDENIIVDDYFQAMLCFGEILRRFA